MSSLPSCPQCNSEFTYEDGDLYICPECSHEWPKTAATASEDNRIIKDAHGKDSETGDQTTPLDDMLGTFDELQKADNATQAQMIMYSKLFKINFTKMEPYEFKTFTDILQRYSDLYKPVKGNGRGKKKK